MWRCLKHHLYHTPAIPLESTFLACEGVPTLLDNLWTALFNGQGQEITAIKSQLQDQIQNWENRNQIPTLFPSFSPVPTPHPAHPVVAPPLMRPIPMVAPGPFSPTPSNFAASFPNSPYLSSDSHLSSPFAPSSPAVLTPPSPSASESLPLPSLTRSTPDARSTGSSSESRCDWCYSKSIPCFRTPCDKCRNRKKKCTFTRGNSVVAIDRNTLESLTEAVKGIKSEYQLLSSKYDAIATGVAQQNNVFWAIASKLGVDPSVSV